MNTIAPSSDPKSTLNIVHYMRNNIPFTIVITMAMLNQYVFEDIICTRSAKAGIILTFIFLTVMDVMWTVYHCHVDFAIYYPHTGNKWKKYALARSITSILSFYSLNYFIHRGTPFNCFFDYNEVTANVVLYLSFLLIATVSYAEHFYWKKLSIPLLPEMEL